MLIYNNINVGSAEVIAYPLPHHSYLFIMYFLDNPTTQSKKLVYEIISKI